MPIRAALALRTHHASHLHAVIVRFGDLPHEGPVPRIPAHIARQLRYSWYLLKMRLPVSSLREYRRDFLERASLRGVVAGTTHVTPNDEVFDDLRATAERHICQDLVELVGDILAARVVYDAPVLPQDAEIEQSLQEGQHAKWSFGRRRWKLLEIAKQNHVAIAKFISVWVGPAFARVVAKVQQRGYAGEDVAIEHTHLVQE